MEGGEERKRKAGPLMLDWDTLLPRTSIDDEEPPPEVVIKSSEVEKPTPSVWTATDWREDESRNGESITRLSDSNLEAKIERMRGYFRMPLKDGVRVSLKDGGEKLRARLKSLEAESERRKILKNDNKFKEATPIADKSAYTGSTDGLSAHVPSVTPQSKFASSFHRRLDDKKAPAKGSAFKEEIVTLNRCKQNKRVNSHFLSKSTQNMGFSSRKSAFKSPRLISVNTDDNQQSNGRQSRSQSSAPLPCYFDRDPSPFIVKSCASHPHASRSPRQNNKTVVHLEEVQPDSDATDQAEKLDQSMKDSLISYPSRDDPGAIEIHFKDVGCLAPECYLTSTIMNFYILYLQKPTSPTAPKKRDYHFLNTYFYKKLKRDVLNKSDRETSFLKLRRWWKGVNIFEKAYIFLPVHESLHWSLVIICIPDKEDESGPIVLHLDSLGMHNSKSVFSDVKSFLIEEWKFLRQGEAVPELPIAAKAWDKLSLSIDDRIIEVPQQRNEYDCGIFVLFFMERFIDEAPERLKTKDLVKFGRQWFKPEEASSLRRKIRNLLIEEFKNANKVSIELDP